MLTFFVDLSWKRDLPHIPLLYPLWGNAASPTHPFYHALFERYQFDTNYYAITHDPKNADLVLMPYSQQVAAQWAPDIVPLVLAASKKYNLPILIDGASDIEPHIDIPNTIVLRYGGYKSEKKSNELTIPLYADDLLERYGGGELLLREKHQKPIVGFSGWAALSVTQTLRAVFKELPQRVRSLITPRYRTHKKGIFFRKQALEALAADPRVTLCSITRTAYSGHTDTAPASPEVLRREFVDNLLESDYGLDVRGDANNSIRLFEILSLGRIPLIIDTDRNLPFSEEIDYQSFACIVDFKDLEKLSEKLAAFHARLTTEQFVEMQRKARATYEEWFRVDKLTPHLIKAIEKKLTLIGTK